MKLGRIVGTVVSTVKDEKIDGLKLFVVRDLSMEMADRSSFVVAADSVGAGVGEVVLYASGSSARQTKLTKCGRKFRPLLASEYPATICS